MNLHSCHHRTSALTECCRNRPRDREDGITLNRMFSNNGITLRDSLNPSIIVSKQQQANQPKKNNNRKLLTATSDVVVDVSLSVSVSAAPTACKHRQALEILAAGKAAMNGTIPSLWPCIGGAAPPPTPGGEDPGSLRGGGVAETSSLLLSVEEVGSVEQRAVVAVVMTKSFQIVKMLDWW